VPSLFFLKDKILKFRFLKLDLSSYEEKFITFESSDKMQTENFDKAKLDSYLNEICSNTLAQLAGTNDLSQNFRKLVYFIRTQSQEEIMSLFQSQFKKCDFAGYNI
jgi:monomeric isocitrate dehydrogenase